MTIQLYDETKDAKSWFQRCACVQCTVSVVICKAQQGMHYLWGDRQDVSSDKMLMLYDETNHRLNGVRYRITQSIRRDWVFQKEIWVNNGHYRKDV